MSETYSPGAHFDFLPEDRKWTFLHFSLVEKGNQSFSHHIRACYLRMLTVCCNFIETFSQREPGSSARTFIVFNSLCPCTGDGTLISPVVIENIFIPEHTVCLSIHISPWFCLFYLVWLHICYFSMKQWIHSQHAAVSRKNS